MLGTTTPQIYKWGKRARSHLLDQVHIPYGVFSPKKVQHGSSSEEKLDKSRMWDILQGNLRQNNNKNNNKIKSAQKLESISQKELGHNFYYFRMKWATETTKQYGP